MMHDSTDYQLRGRAIMESRQQNGKPQPRSGTLEGRNRIRQEKSVGFICP
jgi:hypothetical protein